MTVDVDVLIGLLIIALGVGFTIGVFVGDGRNYRSRKKNTRRPSWLGRGATGVRRQEVNHGNR